MSYYWRYPAMLSGLQELFDGIHEVSPPHAQPPHTDVPGNHGDGKGMYSCVILDDFHKYFVSMLQVYIVLYWWPGLSWNPQYCVNMHTLMALTHTSQCTCSLLTLVQESWADHCCGQNLSPCCRCHQVLFKWFRDGFLLFSRSYLLLVSSLDYSYFCGTRAWSTVLPSRPPHMHTHNRWRLLLHNHTLGQ